MRAELSAFVPQIDTLKPLEWVEIPEDCNWKVSVENYSECYHCKLNHPTFSTGVGAAIPSGASEALKAALGGEGGASALSDALGGRNVGVRGGTTAETWVKEGPLATAKDATLTAFDDHAAGLAAVKSGAVDIYFADQAILVGLGRRGEAEGVGDRQQEHRQHVGAPLPRLQRREPTAEGEERRRRRLVLLADEVDDLRHRGGGADGVEQVTIAARFHNGLARALSELGTALCARHDLHTVALSGGVVQNRTLLHALQQQLDAHGIQVLSNRLVPSNDGGIALGQAAIAAARLCRDA